MSFTTLLLFEENDVLNSDYKLQTEFINKFLNLKKLYRLGLITRTLRKCANFEFDFILNENLEPVTLSIEHEELLSSISCFASHFLKNLDIPFTNGDFIRLEHDKLLISPIGHSANEIEKSRFRAYDKAFFINQKLQRAVLNHFSTNNLLVTIHDFQVIIKQDTLKQSKIHQIIQLDSRDLR